MQSRSPKAFAGWSLALAVVMFYALLPVLWLISLSLKTPATVSDKKFIPQDITFDNYSALFHGGLDSPLLRPLINSVAIALDRDVHRRDARVVHGLRDRAAEVPRQDRHPRRRAGDRDVPADLRRRPAV